MIAINSSCIIKEHRFMGFFCKPEGDVRPESKTGWGT